MFPCFYSSTNRNRILYICFCINLRHQQQLQYLGKSQYYRSIQKIKPSLLASSKPLARGSRTNALLRVASRVGLCLLMKSPRLCRGIFTWSANSLAMGFLQKEKFRCEMHKAKIGAFSADEYCLHSL